MGIYTMFDPNKNCMKYSKWISLHENCPFHIMPLTDCYEAIYCKRHGEMFIREVKEAE